MDLNKIKTAITDHLKEKGIKVFDISYRRSDSVLEVLMDEQMDMGRIEEISADISAFLDAYDDEFEDNYFLDVSTVGIERPIRNREELASAVGSYICVRQKDKEYLGTLCSVDDGVMDLEVKDKNRRKHVSLNYEETEEIRYAVEF